MAYPLANRPTSREQFKEYCLRALGAPVLNIEIDEAQVDDRIDEALRWFWEYHSDGTDHAYYKYQVTGTDITNKYIQLPDNLIGAVSIFPFTSSSSVGSDMFNIQYQLAQSDLYRMTSVEMTPYFMTMQHLQFIEYLLIGQQPVRYNRHNNQFHIDMDWSRINVGDYIVVDAYQIVDPDTYTNAWSDRWLLRYATALIKRQWGTNLKKYVGMQMPGGIVFNGQQIYNEADAEIQAIERDVIHSQAFPALDFIG